MTTLYWREHEGGAYYIDRKTERVVGEVVRDSCAAFHTFRALGFPEEDTLSCRYLGRWVAMGAATAKIEQWEIAMTEGLVPGVKVS